MSSPKSFPWILAGYEMFALEGASSVNVESIARAIGKNKSSFYHYFGSMEGFEQELLGFHIQQVKEFAEQARKCKNVKPEILQLFVKYKIDFFFHKQLRINRDKPVYQRCFDDAFTKVEESIIEQWAAFLQLENQVFFAQTFFRLVAENFLLQITDQSFHYEWLLGYTDQINALLRQMKANPKA